MTAQSPRLRFDPSLWASLTSPEARPPDAPAFVQFALLPQAVAELGRTITVETEAERILARF
jgi:histidine phosphotransferase ChpT